MKQLLITIAALVLVGCSKPQPPSISIIAAAHDGNIEAVKQHIAAGTDVNAKNNQEETALYHACMPFIRTDNPVEIVELLIENGADVNVKSTGITGWTPIHQASQILRYEDNDTTAVDIIELLIENGADVNAKDRIGLTPLHHAATMQIVKLLIAKGGDVNAQDDDGSTPLDAAIDGDITETADLLRKHGGKTGEELKAEGK